MLLTRELGLGAIGLEIKIWKSFTQRQCWKRVWEKLHREEAEEWSYRVATWKAQRTNTNQTAGVRSEGSENHKKNQKYVRIKGEFKKEGLASLTPPSSSPVITGAFVKMELSSAWVPLQ